MFVHDDAQCPLCASGLFKLSRVDMDCVLDKPCCRSGCAHLAVSVQLNESDSIHSGLFRQDHLCLVHLDPTKECQLYANMRHVHVPA